MGLPGYERITITLPEALLRRIRGATDNVSRFVAEAVEERFAAEAFALALRETHGTLVSRLGRAPDPEEVLASLHSERTGWTRAGE